MKTHSVTILGSTGSIGVSTLDVIARHPDRYRVEALIAGKNAALLFRQCLQFRPRFVVLNDEKLAKDLQTKLQAENCLTEILHGAAAMQQIAADSGSDCVMSAIVGAAGLLPTLAAIKAGKRVLLANKESLVMAANVFMDAVKQHQSTLLPVDSEHNAIFQCLPKDFLPGRSTLQGVHSLILTASGGPFRATALSELKHKTPAEACAHPNWSMGTKISIDSATMMNKGLELIEAYWLFGLPLSQIQIVIHPQSVIHSCVMYEDSSMLAQLGCADMRIPIANALGWPERIQSGAKRLNLAEISRLDFETVSLERFPCVRLAYQALNAGGTATAILNATNEVAVNAFCTGRIRFDQIAALNEAVLSKVTITDAKNLDSVLEADRLARESATKMLSESVYFRP